MLRSSISRLTVACLLTSAALTGAAAADQAAIDAKAAIEGANLPWNGVGPTTAALDEPIVTNHAPEALGTIQYDDGVVTAVPGGTGSVCFGNRFDVANGSPVMVSGSVTQVSFFMQAVSGNVFVSVFGPQAGTAAPVLTSVSVPAAASVFNTHVFGTPVNYTGANFLAGVWADPSPIADLVGLGSGTTAGQGFHGMVINDIAGTGFSTLPGINALVRASGDVLGMPVELIDLGLTVSESADPVVAGSGPGNLVYTATLTNAGPDTATGVAVTETLTLPAGVTVDSVVASVGAYADPVWTVGSVATADSPTLTVTLTVDGSTALGTDVITSMAAVSASNGTDSNPANDADSESTSVTDVLQSILDIPALGWKGMLLLGALLAGLAFVALRTKS
ncbi:MAG: DUF11 domain-containing protein [Thermoanaerobaculia bacterium]|nr:DUF11 domain-containing protein [Thermoanaerobaculia bacterium]